MVNGMALIGIMLFYLHPQIKTSGIMDISSIINDIASKLSGTNALIQIQVNDKYYTKRVGDINLLADNPEHLAVRDNRSFPEWMQQQIHALRLSKGTICNHQNTLDVLRGFRYNFTFSDITYEFILEFDSYVKSLGYAVNTLAKFMKIFKRYVNLAIDNDIMLTNPFRKYHIHQEQTKKNTLTEGEIKKIENSVDRLEGDEKEVAKGFLFSVYTGLRFSDIRRVQRSDIKTLYRHKWLVMRMKKTDREVRVPISRMFGGKAVDMTEIKYGKLFRLPSNARTNIILDRITNRLGIKKHISFHCARHTLATLLLLKGVNMPVIASILGHTSINTTQVYTTIKDRTINKEIRKAFR